jgi:hypothetical protein
VVPKKRPKINKFFCNMEKVFEVMELCVEISYEAAYRVRGYLDFVWLMTSLRVVSRGFREACLLCIATKITSIPYDMMDMMGDSRLVLFRGLKNASTYGSLTEEVLKKLPNIESTEGQPLCLFSERTNIKTVCIRDLRSVGAAGISEKIKKSLTSLTLSRYRHITYDAFLLPSLTKLDVVSIPHLDESIFHNLPNLRDLTVIRFDQIVLTLSNPSILEVLRIKYSRLTFGNKYEQFSSLRKLTIKHSEKIEWILEIKKFPVLDSLYVSNIAITGGLALILHQLTNLVNLSLGSFDILDNLILPKQIYTLSMDYSTLLSDCITSFTNLRNLSIRGSPIFGSTAIKNSDVKKLTNLTSLDITGNDIINDDAVSTLCQLRLLHAFRTFLTNKALVGMTALEDLDLSNDMRVDYSFLRFTRLSILVCDSHSVNVQILLDMPSIRTITWYACTEEDKKLLWKGGIYVENF